MQSGVMILHFLVSSLADRDDMIQNYTGVTTADLSTDKSANSRQIAQT